MYNQQEVNSFLEKIKEYYVVNWIVDNLPSAIYVANGYDETEFFQGFPVGGTMVEDKTGEVVQHFLNNHHRIIIKYHVHKSNMMHDDLEEDWQASEQEFDNGEITARIVGLDVEPFSVKHTYDGPWDDTKEMELTSCKQGVKHMNVASYVQALDDI